MKYCNKCETDKPEIEFYRYRDGHQAYCKDCQKTLMQERRDANRARYRAIALAYHYRHQEARNAERREKRKKEDNAQD